MSEKRNKIIVAAISFLLNALLLPIEHVKPRPAL